MKKLILVLVMSALIGLGAVAVYAQGTGSDDAPKTGGASPDATEQADTPNGAGEVDQPDGQDATNGQAGNTDDGQAGNTDDGDVADSADGQTDDADEAGDVEQGNEGDNDDDGRAGDANEAGDTEDQDTEDADATPTG